MFLFKKSMLSVLLLVYIVLFLPFCGKKVSTVLLNVALMENPGDAKIKWVPNSNLKRGEFVNIQEKKEINGKTYLKVQIEGVSTTGWLDESWVHDGKLKEVYVLQDSDLFQRPNIKSPKAGRVLSGQVAFELEKAEGNRFSLIQYPGKEAYIESKNLGADKSLVRKQVFLPGLGKASVSASSQFIAGPGRELEFDVRNLFDGSLQTAWCEGVDGNGIGEKIEINFDEPVTVSLLKIVTGWTKSEEIFKVNNRVSQVGIDIHTMNEENIKFVGMLSDDVYDYQDVPMEYTGTGVWGISISIDDIFKGKDPDTCISEIQIIGSKYQGPPPGGM